MKYVGLESYSLDFRNLLHLTTNAMQNLQIWSEIEMSMEFYTVLYPFLIVFSVLIRSRNSSCTPRFWNWLKLLPLLFIKCSQRILCEKVTVSFLCFILGFQIIAALYIKSVMLNFTHKKYYMGFFNCFTHLVYRQMWGRGLCKMRYDFAVCQTLKPWSLKLEALRLLRGGFALHLLLIPRMALLGRSAVSGGYPHACLDICYSWWYSPCSCWAETVGNTGTMLFYMY